MLISTGVYMTYIYISQASSSETTFPSAMAQSVIFTTACLVGSSATQALARL